jgi:hypothetical protein
MGELLGPDIFKIWWHPTDLCICLTALIKASKNGSFQERTKPPWWSLLDSLSLQQCTIHHYCCSSGDETRIYHKVLSEQIEITKQPKQRHSFRCCRGCCSRIQCGVYQGIFNTGPSSPDPTRPKTTSAPKFRGSKFITILNKELLLLDICREGSS